MSSSHDHGEQRVVQGIGRGGDGQSVRLRGVQVPPHRLDMTPKFKSVIGW